MQNIEWLICRDPVHIGGADSSSRGNRNPIYRLPDGTPVIPGSSLRGALREHAEDIYENNRELVTTWFGSESSSNGENNRHEEKKMIPGSVALGWAFPLWFPIHVLGYGNWWITCPAWLKRYWQLQGDSKKTFSCNAEDVYWTSDTIQTTVHFRWLKLSGIEKYPNFDDLPLIDSEMDAKKRLIVPDDKINLFVEMGLIRQPRVSLKSREDFFAELEAKQESSDSAKDKTDEGRENPDDEDNNTLVNHLFSVEGLPPGAVFFFAWATRNVKPYTPQSDSSDDRELSNKSTVDVRQWTEFLRTNEHYIGGLWSIGYGRVSILEAKKQSQNRDDANEENDPGKLSSSNDNQEVEDSTKKQPQPTPKLQARPELP